MLDRHLGDGRVLTDHQRWDPDILLRGFARPLSNAFHACGKGFFTSDAPLHWR
jgi:hypothetical protein